MICKTYAAGKLGKYKYVVIFANYDGKWIFCKHKKRNTFEAGGGHIEAGETPVEAAKRELYEETGCVGFDIYPVCDYFACDEPVETEDITFASGMVFVAKVYEIGKIPESEMETIKFFDKLPDHTTYPDIYGEIFPIAVKKLETL